MLVLGRTKWEIDQNVTQATVYVKHTSKVYKPQAHVLKSNDSLGQQHHQEVLAKWKRCKKFLKQFENNWAKSIVTADRVH